MVFSSAIFIFLFLPLVLLCYFLSPRKLKNYVLLFFSLVFYIFGGPKFLLVLLAVVLIDYVGAILIHKTNKKKLFLILTITCNILVLVYFKYTGFFLENVNSIFGLKITIPKIVLPIGISFYTFQAMSYVIDVYRGKYEADKNFARVALFVSFFPQMVEGPIGRYDDLAHQLYEPHKFSYENAKYGIQLMLWGYFKKMVIADRAALFVNTVFGNYQEYSGIPIFVAVVFYTLQIYAEFSGCMDIVTGTAQIMGIKMAENFRRPFFSKSVQEFWRRWHITLGTWLKDYVFYPVSLSKATVHVTNGAKKIFKKSYISKLIPAAFALFFVWLGNGIWHGASVKYICYGLYYYVIMILGMLFEPLGDKIVKIFKIDKDCFGYRLWQMLRTTAFVLFGMLIFRATSLENANQMFMSMFTSQNIGMIFDGRLYNIGFTGADFIVLIIGMIIMFVVSLLQEKGYNIRETISKQNIPFRWCLYYMIIFAIILFGIYGPGYNVSDFIYGQF